MNEVKEITYEQVVQELEELVAVVGPGHTAARYEGSQVYVHPATLANPARPECLIGRWLFRSHNIPLAWLHGHEGVSIETLITILNTEHLLPPVERKAAAYLSFCQDKQDAGYEWGRVLILGARYIEHQWESAVA